MAAFNLTAQLNLVGPTNVKKIAADIRREIGTVQGSVEFRINPSTAVNASKLNIQLRKLNSTLVSIHRSARSASADISHLNSALGNTQISKISSQASQSAKSISDMGSTSKSVSKDFQAMGTELAEFGRQSGLAIRRFAAFSIVSSIVYKLNNALSGAITNFIDFDKELVRVAQVTGKDVEQLSGLVNEITKLSTSLGVTSEDLIQVSSTLAQAGLSASETEQALKALALSANAPSFDSLNDTVEGSIALMRQFGIKAKDLEKALGAINAVSAQFAVESSDIITAIQRTGGVFATASRGVSQGSDALNEFIAVFTSIRATTRESAETIATGLRTIFARIQRKDTIEALKQYGVILTDLEGKFVGPYEAVRRLSEGLSKLDPRNLEFSQIVEELGGFRQIGKVIPLIQQFATAEDALRVAQEGAGSLAADNAKAQLSLANKLTKVREEFVALVREFARNDAFQGFLNVTLSITTAILKLARAGKGLFPLLTIIGGLKAISGITEFAGGFAQGVKPKAANQQGGVAKNIGQNLGEVITGNKSEKNNIDLASIDALQKEISSLIPSIVQLATEIQSSIIELSANTVALSTNTASIEALTQAISSSNFGGGSTLNSGGIVRKFAKGGFVPGSGSSDSVPAMLTPGEFVIRKKVVENIGTENLHRLNKYAYGGKVKDLAQYYKSIYSKPGYEDIENQSITDNSIFKEVKPTDMSSDDISEWRGSYIPRWKKFEYFLSQKYNLGKPASPKFALLDFPDSRSEAKFMKRGDTYDDPDSLKGNNDATIAAKNFLYENSLKSGQANIKPDKLTTRAIADKPVTVYWADPEKFSKQGLNDGGLIQKFMAGGIAEQVEAMTIEKAAKKGRAEIIDTLKKKRGGIDDTARAVGISAAEIYSILGVKNPDASTKTLQDAIRKEYVKTYNRQAGAAKGVETRLQNRGLEFAAAGMFNKGEKLGSVNDVIESDKLSSAPTVKIIRGVLNKNLAENLETMFMEGSKQLASKASEMVMTSDILQKFGLGRQLNLDFDRTLAIGADDILSDPSTPKFAEFGDRSKVADALKTAKLTPLGSELVGLVKERSDLISYMRVITARPKSTLDLIQGWLSEKGLPIPLNQFTGLGGPTVSASQIADLKASLLEPGSLFVDDDPRNIQAATKRKSEGIESYQYGANLITPNINTESTIQGGLMEWVIQNLGGPGAVKGFGFDFPQGLGEAAKYFNIPDDIPTDVKRTISGPSTIKDNIITYLKNVMGYAKGGKVDYYSLEKNSGLASREFDALVQYAKTNDFSLEEFQQYLKQRLTNKQQNSQLMMNPTSLLRAITPEPARTTDVQRTLAEQLKGPVDAKYNPKYDNALKGYANGGLVPGTGNRDTVPAMLNAGDFVIRKSSVKKLGFASGGQVPALLTPGEYVVPKAQAQKIGYGTLNRMNKLGKYNAGGTVGFIQNFADGTGTGGAKPAEIEISPEAEKEIKKLREEMANLWMMAGRKMGYAESGASMREVQGMQLTAGARRAMYAANPAKSGEELAQRIETESGEPLRPKASEFFRGLSPQLAKNAELYEQGGFNAKYSQTGGVVDAFQTGRYGANDPKIRENMQKEVEQKLKRAEVELEKIAKLEEKISNIRKGGAKAAIENPKPVSTAQVVTPVPSETPKPIVQTTEPPKPPFKFNTPPPPSGIGGSPPFRYNMPPPPGGKPPGPPKFFTPPPPSQLVPMLKRQQAEAIGAKKAALATGGVTSGQEYEDLKFKYTKQAGRTMGLSRTVVERKNLKAGQQTQEEEKKQKEKETKARDTKVQQLSEKTKINTEILLIKAILDNTKTIRACYCKDVRGDTGAENTEELINSVNDLKQNVVTLDETVKEKNKAEATAAEQEAGTTEGKNPFEDDKITVPFVDMLDSLSNKAESAGNKLNAKFSDAAGNVTKFGLAAKGIADTVAQSAARTANGLASLNEQFVNTKTGSVFQGLSNIGGLLKGFAATAALKTAAESAGGYETDIGTALNIGSSVTEFATSVGTATSAMGPLGTAVGTAVGALAGLAKGFYDLSQATEERRIKELEIAKDDSIQKATADIDVFFSSLDPNIKDLQSGFQNLSDVIQQENDLIESSIRSAEKYSFGGFGPKVQLTGAELAAQSKEVAAGYSASANISKNILSQTMQAGNTNLAGTENILGADVFKQLTQRVAEGDASYQKSVTEAQRMYQDQINQGKSKLDAEKQYYDTVQSAKDAALKRAFSEKEVEQANKDFRKTVTDVRKRLEGTGVGILERIATNTPEENRDFAKNINAAQGLFAGDATAMQKMEQKAAEKAYATTGGSTLEKQKAADQARSTVRKNVLSTANEFLQFGDQKSPEIRNLKAMMLETSLKSRGVDTNTGLAKQVLDSLRQADPELEAEKNHTDAMKKHTEAMIKDANKRQELGTGEPPAPDEVRTQSPSRLEAITDTIMGNSTTLATLASGAATAGLNIAAYRRSGRIERILESEKNKPVPTETEPVDEAKAKKAAVPEAETETKPKRTPGEAEAPGRVKPVPTAEGGASKSKIRGRAGVGAALVGLAAAGYGFFSSGSKPSEEKESETGKNKEEETMPPSPEIIGLLSKIEENTRNCCNGGENISSNGKQTEYTSLRETGDAKAAQLEAQLTANGVDTTQGVAAKTLQSLRTNTEALKPKEPGTFDKLNAALSTELGTPEGAVGLTAQGVGDVMSLNEARRNFGTDNAGAGMRSLFRKPTGLADAGGMALSGVGAGMQTIKAAADFQRMRQNAAEGNTVYAGLDLAQGTASTLNALASTTGSRSIALAGDVTDAISSGGRVLSGQSLNEGTLISDTLGTASSTAQTITELPSSVQSQLIQRVAQVTPQAVSQPLMSAGGALGIGQAANLGKLGIVGAKTAGSLALGTVLSGGFNAYEAISDPSKYNQKMMKASGTGEEGRASSRLTSTVNDIFGTKFETATGAAGTAMDMLVGAMEGFVDPIGTIVQGLYVATGSVQDFGGALYNIANEGSVIRGAGKLSKQEEESRTSRYTMDQSGNVTKEEKNKEDYDYGLSTEESGAVRSYASSQKQLEQVQELAKSGGDLSGFAQQFGLQPGATKEQVVAQAERAFANSTDSLRSVAKRKAGEKTWFGADQGMIDKQFAGYTGSAARYLEQQQLPEIVESVPKPVVNAGPTSVDQLAGVSRSGFGGGSAVPVGTVPPNMLSASVLDQAKAEYDQIEAEKAKQQAAPQGASYNQPSQQMDQNLFRSAVAKKIQTGTSGLAAIPTASIASMSQQLARPSAGVITNVGTSRTAGTPEIGNVANMDPAAISEALSGTFNNFITALQNIQLPKIPEKIVMEGTHTVEVIINGAEALKSIDEGIRIMVTDKINEAMKKINNTTEGGFGPQ